MGGKRMKEKQESQADEQPRTYTRDVKVPKSGRFFNFKIISQKDIEKQEIEKTNKTNSKL